MASMMTPRQAAWQWLAADRAIRATGADALVKQREAAAKVLKEHMAAKNLNRYAGVLRMVGSGGKRLADSLVLEALGPERYEACKREASRVSLIDASPPVVNDGV